MKCSNSSRPFTAQQEAAILRLYVEKRMSGLATAKRLRLDGSRVYQFLHERGVFRPRGYHNRKLDAAKQKRLESELPTTPNIVLARRYGLSRERVRQIRRELGYRSSRFLQQERVRRARAQRQQRREQEWQRGPTNSASSRTGRIN